MLQGLPVSAEGQGVLTERPQVLEMLKPGDYAFVAGVMKKNVPLEGGIAERNDVWKAVQMREVLSGLTTAKQVVGLGGFIQSAIGLLGPEGASTIVLSTDSIFESLRVTLLGVKRWEQSQISGDVTPDISTSTI